MNRINRINSLFDGVSAIAITMLAFNIKPPDSIKSFNMDTINLVLPYFVSFTISFIAIASIWRFHHRIMSHIIAYKKRILTYSVLILFFVALLPIFTLLIANFSGQFLPILIYIINYSIILILLGLLSRFIIKYKLINNILQEEKEKKVAFLADLFINLSIDIAMLVIFINTIASIVILVIGLVSSIISRRYFSKKYLGYCSDCEIEKI